MPKAPDSEQDDEEGSDPLDTEPPDAPPKKAAFPRDFGGDRDPLDEDEDDPLDGVSPDEARRLRGVPDMLKKAMVAGLGAIFMTEEGIRTMVRDLKLPKEVIGFIVGQAEKSKSDLTRVIGDEIRRFFENPALRQEIIKLMSEVTIEIKAEIKLKPEGTKGAIDPDIKISEANVKRSGKPKKG